MYLLRLLRQTAAEVREVLRAGTPTHARLRDRLVAIALVTTVGVDNPISFSGRVLDVAMEIYAITVIGSLAGSLGAFLVKRGEELDAAAKPA